MGTGTWSESNRPTIPGFYNRFQSAAEETAKGSHGVLGMPVKSNWGPVKTVTAISVNTTALTKLKKTFGESENFSAYKLGKLALLGKPKSLLLYRLTDGTEKVASVALKNTAATPADALKLETKYPTTRAFNVTIRTNLSDASTKDLILFEGSTQIATLYGLSGSISDIATLINNSNLNQYIVATAIGSVTGPLATVANQSLTGGNDGVATITNAHYLAAMTAFEGYRIDGFVLDGITDESLQASISSWISSKKKEGFNIIGYVGGKSTDSLETANGKSQGFNYEGIVNVYAPSATYDGVSYSSSEVAVYIAALATGQTLKESLCNQATIFEDIQPRLSKTEIESALEAGTLILAMDDDEVIVVDDVNTLKTYSDEKGKVFGSIRAVKFLNAVDTDTALTRKDYVGKIDNTDTGRAIIICGLKKYFETLNAESIIKNDFTVEVDEELQANAESDEFFWKWDADYVNVIKRIYGTGSVS